MLSCAPYLPLALVLSGVAKGAQGYQNLLNALL